ncbi:MAG TPA: hypothetical protein VGG64_08940 [Pirellulales bacterium]|jgi:hypothetical protein
MAHLYRDAAEQLREHGRFGRQATERRLDFRFTLEADYAGLLTRAFFGVAQRVQFQVVDGPGGVLLPDDSVSEEQAEKVRRSLIFAELIEAFRAADSIILCADATDEQASSAFFKSIMEILRMLPDGRLACRQMLILLTKAERYFARYDERAEQTARTTDPWPHVLRMMTRAGLGNVLLAVSHRRTEISSTWVSAHGFLPDGRSNMDSSGDRLRAAAGADAQSRYWQLWQPFQVLDPLVYLTTRAPGNLWFVDPSNIARQRA